MAEILKRCYFYGVATPYAHEAAEMAARARVEVAGYIHNRPELPAPGGLMPLLTPDDLPALDRSVPVIFPMITPGFRKMAMEEASRHGFKLYGNLLDPTAVLARSAVYGDGFSLNAAAVVGANCTFGIQVLINRSASVGHDVHAADYVTFGPGCVITGNCVIGKGTFIGAGAVILPGRRIGENCIIGAGAVVTADVEDRSVVVGNPARAVKNNIAGYQDISV